MFDDWKQAWRQAVENFQRESGADGSAPPRVRAMQRELTSAAGALGRLDEEIQRVLHELAVERDAEAVCRRREQLARDVNDDVTVQIAIEYGTRHSARVAVLERKSAVLTDERDLLASELAAMKQVLADTPPAQVGAADSATPAPDANRSDDHVFTRMERDLRERAADERLEELKRKMRS